MPSGTSLPHPNLTGADPRGCPECGSDRSVEIDLCDVCFAELGERDGASSGPLFWDLD